MCKEDNPLVSIVTPVYNGEKYIEECIKSVLAQTYYNWEYTIVNNCSTDRTYEIAKYYAKKDKRIRIHNNEIFLNVIQNLNNALRQISPQSKYCKEIHADDYLFPECVEKMVSVAESNPSVGIVGSYYLFGKEILGEGILYPETIINGIDLCRKTLRGDIHVFGSPSTLLIRSDLIRAKASFYNESMLHADTDVCYDILNHSDFGYVHQILTYMRDHEDSVKSTVSEKLGTSIIETIYLFIKYGKIYLNDDEYNNLIKKKVRNYYKFLGKSMIVKRNKKFWEYHKYNLEKIGYKLNLRILLYGLFMEIIFRLLNMQDSIKKTKNYINKNRKKIC